jgi:glycosyltransferase involved in cell wall biosynthesis
VSVVVPVRNEEENIPALAAEIAAALERVGRPWECLWVNDGSTDGTQAVLDRLARAQPRHRVICLDGNFGQSAALAAGFARARGPVVCTLDGDGQNDPADLPGLLERLGAGDVDMVNGIRQLRRDTWTRRAGSRIANGFRNLLTGERVRDVGCSIRAFRREGVEGLPLFKGMHRFLPTLVRMKGFRITEMPVRHRPRTRGRTKYGISNRLWVGLADTFAVCWMQRRLVWPKVRSETPVAGSGRPSG